MRLSSSVATTQAAVVAAILACAAPGTGRAGSFSTLYSFTGGADGGSPGPVTLNPTGGLYGAAQQGGIVCTYNFGRGCGTIYSLSASGQISVLATLDGQTMGAFPDGTLALSGATLYGSAYFGGARVSANGGGTIFALSTNGSNFTVLHSFGPFFNGYGPMGPLVVDAKHYVFGTASAGGDYNGGVLFVITPTGAYRKLHDFNPQTEGGDPQGISSDASGNLYGTLYGYAPGYCAPVYKYVLATGAFSIIQKTCYDGVPPEIGTISSSGTIFLGNRNENDLFALQPAGPAYVYTPIYTFSALTGGNNPNAPVKSGSVLTGTTVNWDDEEFTGSLFTYDKAGVTTLHVFTGGADGDEPLAPPSVSSTGIIYGTTEYGGAPTCAIAGLQPYGCGVVYQYTP